MKYAQVWFLEGEEESFVALSFPKKPDQHKIDKALTVGTIRFSSQRGARRAIRRVVDRCRIALALFATRTVRRIGLGISPEIELPPYAGEFVTADTVEEYLSSRTPWLNPSQFCWPETGNTALVFVDIAIDGISLNTNTRELIRECSDQIRHLPREAQRALKAYLAGVEDPAETYAIHLYRAVEAAKNCLTPGIRSWAPLET